MTASSGWVRASWKGGLWTKRVNAGLARRRRGEDVLSRTELVDEATKRPDIGLYVVRLTVDELRRHVVRRLQRGVGVS